jgi:hypothetical protein
MIGMFTDISSVRFESLPTLSHCVEKPAIAGGGTGRICWSITLSARVIWKPYLLKSSKSAPYSVSVETSGRRNWLPIWLGESDTPSPPIE